MIKTIFTSLKVFVLILLAFALLPQQALAATSGQFSWEIPNTREDGSSLPVDEIAGYTLYQDDEVLVYVVGGVSTSTTVEGIEYGNRCFTISTTDIYNQEGQRSEQECVDVFPAPPSASVFLSISF